MIGRLLKGVLVGKALKFAMRKFSERGTKRTSY